MKTVDIEAAVASPPVLRGRGPHTPEGEAAKSFAALAAIRAATAVRRRV